MEVYYSFYKNQKVLVKCLRCPPPVRRILAIGTEGKAFIEKNCKHFSSNVSILEINTYLLYQIQSHPVLPTSTKTIDVSVWEKQGIQGDQLFYTV